MARPYRVEVPCAGPTWTPTAMSTTCSTSGCSRTPASSASREWFPTATSWVSGLVVTHHVIEYLRPLVYRAQPVEVEMW